MDDENTYISTDEFGRYWIFDWDSDEPFSGPYDTPEDARKALKEDE